MSVYKKMSTFCNFECLMEIMEQLNRFFIDRIYVGGMYIGTLYVLTYAGFSVFITIVTRIYVFPKSNSCISDTDLSLRNL